MANKASLPLRLGLIGLSSKSTSGWASSAHLPALLSEHGKKNYIVKALLNSNEDSARTAIKHYNFPSDTKAYGKPEDLANDPDIDVILCSVRVDSHLPTILPSIKAGKSVYVEWPIAADATEIQEIVAAAEKSGAKVAIGAQGPWIPVITKIREIVQSGKYGKVLSSNINAFGGITRRDALPPGLKYFTDWKIGGNPITIGFGHLLNSSLHTLGDLVQGTTSALTQIQRPLVKIVNSETAEVVETSTTNVPDLIHVHGQLTSSANNLVNNASYSVRYRNGPPFKNEPALTWHINFENAELRLSSLTTALQAFGYDQPAKIEIHDFGQDKVEEIAWQWPQEQKELPDPARGVFYCLNAFAEGNESGYIHLKEAAKRAEQIDAWVSKGRW